MQLDRSTVKSGAVVPMVGLISNPKSTTNAGGMEKVRRLVSESGNVVHYELDGPASVDDALALLARANPAVLIINGGDGTIGMVLAALLHRSPFKVIPPIVLLPGGKTNMTAADLGARGCPEKVLRRALSLLRRGKLADRLTSRNLLELDMGDGTPPRVGTFLGAAGVVKAIFWCRRHAYARGLPNVVAHGVSLFTMLGAALAIGPQRKLMRSNPMRIRVRGGGALEGRYMAVFVTSLNSLLFGLKPFGREGQGGLGFAAVEPGTANVMRAFVAVLGRWFGRTTVKGAHTRRSDQVVLECTDPLTLDGEIYTPKPGVPITVRGDRALTFVRL